MNVSFSTLSLAIPALDNEIIRYEKLLQDTSLGEDEQEDYGQYVLDLMKALSELSSLYEDARKEHPNSLPVDKILPPR